MAPRILGIDPGTRQLGWGILSGGSRPALVAAGVCRARPSDAAPRRLIQLQTELRRVFDLQAPEVVAIESSFFGKNAQTLLRLGEARGMVIGLAGSLDLEVVDYTPAEIKKAVTGRGNATKDAVARMVRTLLRPPAAAGTTNAEPSLDDPVAHDLTDALAVALCHAHRARFQDLHSRGVSS